MRPPSAWPEFHHVPLGRTRSWSARCDAFDPQANACTYVVTYERNTESTTFTLLLSLGGAVMDPASASAVVSIRKRLHALVLRAVGR